VIDDAENTKLAAWMNETPAIIINVQKQPGANVIQVVDRVKQLLPTLTSSLPASIEVHSSRTAPSRFAPRCTTRCSSSRRDHPRGDGDLRLPAHRGRHDHPEHRRAASIVGTFGVMYLAGFSINNLTLMALTIATGFVVDDAIVVIENIARYIERGDKPMDAALKGTQQIAFTIISLTSR